MEKTDLLIKNARVFNSYYKKFLAADIYVLEDKIFYIDYKKNIRLEAKEIIDAGDRHVIPGLIDIHMHIESSMLTPRAFCSHVVSHGVTSLVAEPHEIANVRGLGGVIEMIKAGEESIIDVFYGIPSSVPSTNSKLETTGGEISFEDMKKLYQYKNVVCVGEVMNYRQVIRENDLEISKFLSYIRKEDPSFTIEGHCPSLVDLDLAKFLYLGINGDHTEHSLEEIKQRFENGMFVELQEKMLREDIINFIVENKLYEHMSFVTDDVMVDDFYKKGHLDRVLVKAIEKGFPLEEAIYCASYTAANRMNLRDRGVIGPGKLADLVILDSIEDFIVNRVLKKGKIVYSKDKKDLYKLLAYKFPQDYYRSIKLDKLTEDDFTIRLSSKVKMVKVRTMQVKDGTTQIQEGFAELAVENGQIKWENTDYMLAAVFERYGLNKSVGYGFVTGDTIKSGAFASTWVHDHHNLLVVGSDRKTMAKIANKLIDQQGGIIVGKDEEVLANLALPVCGILSDEPVKSVADSLEKVKESLISLGYRHYNPIMSLGTYGLPVSPYLKLTNMGLVDVAKGKLVDLIVECK